MSEHATDNPLLQLSFEIPFDRIRAQDVVPAVDRLTAEAQKRIDAIGDLSAPPTYENTMQALEAATEQLELAMTVIGHLESVVTTPELREAYNESRPKVSAFYSSIPTNAALWNAVKAFAATDEASTLSPTKTRYLQKTLDDFRRHGAELSESGKERLKALDVELTSLTTQFSQSLLDATNAFELLIEDEARLAGLPDSARQLARHSAAEKGKSGYRFTLQAPSVNAVLTYLDDASIRQAVWRAYNTRATRGPLDNRPRIARILELRKEKARLLGYSDFADLVLEDRMAQNGARADAFVADLRAKTEAFAKQENEELLAFRRELEGSDSPPLEPWDIAYYAEKLRKARFDFDEEELRPYFSADRVLRGIFETVRRLYGVRIEERQLPVWEPSVRSFAFVDDSGNTTAAFYVDLYPRENKRGGAWMNPLITAVPDKEGAHLGLFCANVDPPVGDKAALLTHRNVETLFHEFGHLMHHCASDVEVRSLGGTNVAWDFVELPSQIMENWCWEREALDLFATHHETDEPIPPSLFEKMRRARTFRAANAMMRQLGLATVDLALHRHFDPERDGDVLAFSRSVLAEFAPAPLPQDYAMIAGFSHLFAGPVAYASGYYSYKWAEVLDADAFSRFQQEGIYNPEVGREFYEKVLKKGDSRDPIALFEDFLGRQPRLDALLERSGLSLQG
ncbi:MAG: M3 family metallopeptidase [Myxococcota bacterium]